MTAVQERVSAYLDGVHRERRDIATPEGVPLPVEIASFAERATAFMLDLVLWFGASLLLAFLALLFVGLVGLLHGGETSRTILLGALFFLSFLARNFYFIQFELAWRGATPGKRAVGLRVIDRGGGPLRPAAIVARNLTREIEMFLPLNLLLSLKSAPGAAVWTNLSLGLWLLLFTALPLFNRERMRAGDFIAGTLVVALPRRVLLADLAEVELGRRFTDRQLRAYGAFELQILEELLRRPDGPETERIAREVCAKICRRIEWPSPVPDAEIRRFLGDFYAAQRAALERDQLFGRLRADKHEGEGAG
jgi:uncharacterized RDD family membrane protein YckC